MIELDPADFSRVVPLFDGLSHHLAVSACLDGAVPGRVWVDDAARPRAAVLQLRHRVYLAGSEQEPSFNAGLGEWLAGVALPRARAAGAVMSLLYYAPERWEPVLTAALTPAPPVRARRQYYALGLLGPRPSVPAPEGFALRFVDRALLAQTHLGRLDALKAEMASERESVDAFLRQSFGVCALRGDEIAGWCLSEYNLGRRCEVGIATADAYRRRGLATALAAAFVELADAQGVGLIGWHCFARNTPSAATARRAGFELAGEYEVLLARLTP